MEDGGWPGSTAPSSILHLRSSKTGGSFPLRCASRATLVLVVRRVIEADRLSHDIERPLADFVVDTAQVLADNAQHDQLDAAEEQDADQRRGLASESQAARQTQ